MWPSIVGFIPVARILRCAWPIHAAMHGHALLGIGAGQMNTLHLHQVEEARTVGVFGNVARRPEILVHLTPKPGRFPKVQDLSQIWRVTRGNRKPLAD